MISYAQNFEDVMLWRALKHIEHGFYIDIGAQDPIVDSVSLAFHEHGWNGVHVEPTPHYAELLRQQRAGDTVIQAAVGNSAAVIKFFEIPDTGISTADSVIAQQHRERGFEVREITVSCIPLAAVFESCKTSEIHWLKIDVEGYEKQVLLSWGDSKKRPWIVVVESTLPLTQIETHETWEPILIKHGYTPVYFDGLNRYYISDLHPELKDAFSTPPNVFDAFSLNGTASATFHHLIDARNQEKLNATIAQTVQEKKAASDKIDLLNSNLASLDKMHNEYEQKTVQEKAELNKQHNEQLLTLQQLQASTEQLLKQQLQVIQQELRQLEEIGAKREQDLSAQTSQARQELATLLSIHAQREQEVNTQLLSIQQQVRQDVADLTQSHLDQVQAIQLKHAEQIQNLTKQQEATLQDLTNILQDRTKREQVLSEQTVLAQQKLEGILHTQVQREQAASTQLVTIQQQSAQEILEQSHHHIQLERALHQKYTDREQTFNQQLQANQQKLISLHAAQAQREQAIGQQLLALQQQAAQEKTELCNQHHVQIQTSSEQLSYTQLELQELKKIREQREQAIGEQLLALQKQAVQEKSELSKHHNEQIQALQEVLATTQASLTWRATAPLRALASLLQLNNKQKTVLTQKIAAPSNAIALPILKPQPTNTHQATIEPNMYNPTHTSQQQATIATSADELLAHHDQHFVQCAYQSLLGRAPDPEGMRYYLGRLRTGISKIQILAQLRTSSEGKTYKTKLPGLNKAIQQYQIGQYPLIGWLFRLLNATESNHPTQRKLRSIENQIFLLSDESVCRFNQLETTLSGLHNIIALWTQSAAMPIALQQQDNIAFAYVEPSKELEPEELKNLSSSARNIYFQLKTAAATHAGKTA